MTWYVFWVVHVLYSLFEFVIEHGMWLRWDSTPNRFTIPEPAVDPRVSFVMAWCFPAIIALAVTRHRRRRTTEPTGERDEWATAGPIFRAAGLVAFAVVAGFLAAVFRGASP